VSRPQLEELVQLEDADWDAALEASGQPFRFSHRSCAGRAFERAYPSYSYSPFRAAFSDGAVALLPVVHVARRFGSLDMALAMPLDLEGRPIVVEGELGADHLDTLREGMEGAGLLTVSGGAGGSPPYAEHAVHGLTHVLDLAPGFEALWETSFSSKNRNSCRKADKAGVAIAEETTPEAAGEYRRLYELAAAGWGYHEPPYPVELFRALVESRAAQLWLARLEGKAIAGALLLEGSEDVLYWSGAMDREHQGVAPSNAILRTAIEAACRRRLSYFDFGASGELIGVERFKASFGAQPREFHSVTSSSRAYRAARRLLQLRPGRGE
jgi:Acetyltransferase (GNAT) domain